MVRPITCGESYDGETGKSTKAAGREAKKSFDAVDRGRFGGPGRDRTDDLFHAMEARSQLRHRPILLRFQYIMRRLIWSS